MSLTKTKTGCEKGTCMWRQACSQTKVQRQGGQGLCPSLLRPSGSLYAVLAFRFFSLWCWSTWTRTPLRWTSSLSRGEVVSEWCSAMVCFVVRECYARWHGWYSDISYLHIFPGPLFAHPCQVQADLCTKQVCSQQFRERCCSRGLADGRGTERGNDHWKVSFVLDTCFLSTHDRGARTTMCG